MSICKLGIEHQFLKAQKFIIEVSPNHPLIQLMNALDWEELSKLILSDLKKSTTKLKWWLGRKLKVRIHLGVFLLQQLLNETDRDIEKQIHDNAVYAVFCGRTFVENWKIPDHTKIEEFRSRLSSETQCMLTNAIVKLAAKKGFAKPEHIDIDSTVQTPDMQYPATVNLLIKAASVGRRVQKIIMDFIPAAVKNGMPEINMKVIKGIAKEHYFEKRKELKQKIEARKQALAKLWSAVSEAIQPAIQFARILDEPFIVESLPIRDKNLITNFTQKAPALLSELFERCYENAPRRSRVLSFHRNAVECFNKNKHHRGLNLGVNFKSVEQEEILFTPFLIIPFACQMLTSRKC